MCYEPYGSCDVDVTIHLPSGMYITGSYLMVADRTFESLPLLIMILTLQSLELRKHSKVCLNDLIYT